MNSEIIIKYFDNVDQETNITIYKGTYKPIEVIKKHILYKIDKTNKTLIILDKYRSELHIINIRSIRTIKFNGKKFGSNTWLNNTKKIVSEGKAEMSI